MSNEFEPGEDPRPALGEAYAAADMVQRIFAKSKHAIIQEMFKVIREKGTYPTDPMRAAAIVVEEACEALSEAMKITNPASVASHRGATGTLDAMMGELVQVATSAIFAIHAMKSKQYEQQQEEANRS